MLGSFFIYFVLFFVIARLVSFMGSFKWMPTVRTTPKKDAIVAVIFALLFGTLI